MGSKKHSNESHSWNLESIRPNKRHLLVICPKCGKLGTLYFSRKIGWYIKHGSKKTHSIPNNSSLEIPLHYPRLNLIRYIGGDSKILTYIAKMIPPHEIYVEVFGGGAPLLLNKPPSKLEIYNDIDDKLVNLFMVIRDNHEKFKKRMKYLLASRTIYYDFLKKLKNNEITDPIEKAIAYYYVIRLSYSGQYGSGLGFGKNVNSRTLLWTPLYKIEQIWYRLKNIIIENLDFRELILRYDSDKTFFYVDPPHLYLSTEKNNPKSGYKYYSYDVFTDKHYMELLNTLEKIRGKFLLKQSTYIPWLIEWAKKNNYHIISITLKKSAKANPKSKKLEVYHLYFISNYKIITY